MDFNIKVFMNTANSADEREILRDMHKGIETCINPNSIPYETWKEFNKGNLAFDYLDRYAIPKKTDLAIMFGSWKLSRVRDKNSTRDPIHHLVRLAIARECDNFLCIETPLLNRTISDSHQYYRVGLNGFLQGEGTFIKNIDYPNDRLNELGIKFNNWQSRGENIIIPLQLPGDASLRHQDINDWCMFAIENIRMHSDRPIDLRIHPALGEKSWEAVTGLYRKILQSTFENVNFVNGQTVSLQEHFDNAYCVVSYTSGTSIDAMVAGIPVIPWDEGNFAYPICDAHVENIENVIEKMPSEEVTQQYLQNLAYHQWTIDEMKSGIVWQHFEDIITESIESTKNESSELYEGDTGKKQKSGKT